MQMNFCPEEIQVIRATSPHSTPQKTSFISISKFILAFLIAYPSVCSLDSLLIVCKILWHVFICFLKKVVKIYLLKGKEQIIRVMIPFGKRKKNRYRIMLSLYNINNGYLYGTWVIFHLVFAYLWFLIFSTMSLHCSKWEHLRKNFNQIQI